MRHAIRYIVGYCHWLFCLFAVPSALWAQMGAIDASFNPVTGADNSIWSMALQADGKIVIGGYFNSYDGVSRPRIARVNSNGTLDASFDPGTGTSGGVTDILVQPDGKIVLVGEFTSYNGTPRNYIARVNADGTLDPTFTIGTGASYTIHDAYLQSDGKIIIVGEFTNYNGTGRNRVARLNTDGTVDVTFTPGTGANNLVWFVTVQPDGKILIGGQFTSYNGTGRNRIARLNADGTLDATFNPGTGANLYVREIAVQADDKIIITGDFTTYNGTGRNRIARLNTNGTLDATFTPGTGANALITACVLQSDGKVVIGGSFTTYNGTGRNRIARLNADGTLDAAFNPGTGADGTIHDAYLQSDGKIIIVGEFTNYNGTGRNRIARLAGDWYTWSGAPGAPWTGAANWTPSRTTPLPSDILQFNAGTHTPTNVPNEILHQLIVNAGANVQLAGAATGNTLVVGTGGVQVAAGATLDMGLMNPVGLFMNAGATCTVNGTLDTRTRAVTGMGSFVLAAGGTLATSRADGINGISAGTGTVQVPGANISYNNAANYIIRGATALTDMNLGAIAGKPAITQLASLYTFGPNTVRYNSNPLTITQNLITANNVEYTCGAARTLTLAVGSASTINGGRFWLGDGTLNVSGAMTIAATGALSPVGPPACGAGSSVIVGGGSVYYQPGGSLSFGGGWTGTMTDTWFPPTMLGDVVLTATGGPTVTLNSSKTIEGTLAIQQGVLNLGTGALTVNGNFWGSGSGVVALNNQHLVLNGAMTLNATTDIQGNGSLSIGGTGAITGDLTHTGDITQFTMNRAGATLPVAGTLRVTNSLSLLNGFVQPTGELLFTNTTPGLPVGGSPTSYVIGTMSRAMTTGAGVTMFYPVGSLSITHKSKS